MGTLASAVVSAMITPAVMISACSGLILSTSNRVGRVVDRIRGLSNEADTFRHSAPSPDQEKRRQLVASQLIMLSQRLITLRRALIALYSSIGLFIAASIGFGFLALIDNIYVWWMPMALSLFGGLSFLIGSLLLLSESRLAVTSTLEEVAFAQHLIELSQPPIINKNVQFVSRHSLSR
ncbi:MAG: DUF2721 domain-containing protein [Pseudomonadota bacterium]